MAICSNCGAEGPRIRSKWCAGEQLPDECPSCAPQSFEKQSDPSDKKIWIAPEVHPEQYTKTYDDQGLIWMPKPEVKAELEAKACGHSSVIAQEEREAQEKAAAEKRAHRRTRPMTASEKDHAMAVVDRYFRPLIEDKTTAYDA